MRIHFDFAGYRAVRRVVALGAIATVLGAGALPALQPATPALAWHDDICWPGGRLTPNDFRLRFPVYDSEGNFAGYYDEGKAEQAYFDFQAQTPGAVFVNGNDACPTYPTATPTTPPTQPTATPTTPPTATPTTPPASTPTTQPSPTATTPPDASPTTTTPPAPTATGTPPPAPTNPPASPSPTTAPPTATTAAPPVATATNGPSPEPTSNPQTEPKGSGPDQTVIWVCLQRPPSAENPTGRMEFPIKRDESGRYRDQWVNFDARGYPIEGPCPPAPTATATATATRAPATATAVPPTATAVPATPTALPTVVASTPPIVLETVPVFNVSEVVTTEVSEAPEATETPTQIIVQAAPVSDAPATVADMYCLVNADLPECRPSTQTSGLGRG